MKVFSFSMDKYNLIHYKSFNKTKIAFWSMVLFFILGFLGILYGIYINHMDFCLISSIFMFVFGFLSFVTLVIAIVDLDYFSVKDTCYIIKDNILYLVNYYPVYKSKISQEFSDIRMYLFLMFGKDFFVEDSTVSPNLDDVINNFDHFILNSNYERLTIEEFGVITRLDDFDKHICIVTHNRNRVRKKTYINKYYNDLDKLVNYVDSKYRGA